MEDPPASSGLQEVVGSCDRFESQANVMVWAEGWPSWLLALEGIGVYKVPFWIHDRRHSMSKALQSLQLSEARCWSWEKAKFLGASSTRIFIQGTHSFVVEKMATALALGIEPAFIIAVEDVALEGLVENPDYEHAHILSHRQVGGITTGRWAVFAPTLRDPEGLHHRLNLKRQLGDVLTSTCHGKECDPPYILRQRFSRKQREFAYPEDMLKVHQPFAKVIAPCVFTTSKFAHRSLSAQELWDAYDIGTKSQSVLPVREGMGSPVDVSFVWAAPLKVLHRVLSCWLPVVAPSGITPLASDTASDDRSMGEPLLSPFLRCTVPPSTQVEQGPDVNAVKHDDAQADEQLWNIRAVGAYRPGALDAPPLVCGRPVSEDVIHLFDCLRQLGFRRFQVNLRRSFARYIHTTYGANVLSPASPFRKWQQHKRTKALKLVGKKRKRHESSPPMSEDDVKWRELELDLEVGRDALRRGVGANWWEWTQGSTLFFWRWPGEYRKQARDGVRVFILNEKRLPRYFKKQHWPKDASQADQVEAKIRKVRDNRGYLELGHVCSLTGFFAVPKGSDDIRMVYDATKCGLNEALWAPNFALPTVESVINNATGSTWFGDIDLGEMFLNYPLDRRIRPYAGVDSFRPPKGDCRDRKRVFHRWNRNAMGMMPSPYNSTQGFAVASEFITGNLADPTNPFSWDTVKLNMPGTPTYNPSMPWCYRWDSRRDELPGFFSTYVDDIRTGGQGEDKCHHVSRRVASRTNYLGQQDAPRKRRKPSKKPGAWCGAIIVNLGDEGLYVTCSQEKWDKGKSQVEEMLTAVEGGALELNRKDLERKRGFLIHLSRTFTYMTPYLKGMHLTMETFRPGREDSGWKMTKQAWAVMLSGEMGYEIPKAKLDEAIKDHKRNNTPPTFPTMVKVAPRFISDLKAMWLLFQLDAPPLRLVRGKSVHEAIYGFGDASGKGFGSSWDEDGEIKFRLGVWGSDGDDTSSNFRELKNLVQTLETMGKQGALEGREIFLFTDNSTSERAFYNGTSSSETLFNLVLQARFVEAKCKCVIRLIHVSGKRMIAQGTDGLSRGNFNEGVMSGQSMLSYVPLAHTALKRSPGIKSWVEDWTRGLKTNLEWLQPEDWFVRGHDMKGSQVNIDGMWMPRYQKGTYVWTPPPCLASFAVEQLRQARHKRTESIHIFLCPKTMSTHWDKDLRKVADLIIDIPPKELYWPATMFEHLTFAVILPFKSCYPWQYRGGSQMVELARSLRHVWEGNKSTTGSVLREFLCKEGLLA